MEISIALIAAGSAILGSIVPQIFGYFTKKEDYKNELRKEYKFNKTKAYQELSEILFAIWLDNMSSEEYCFNQAKEYYDNLEKYQVTYGIWLSEKEYGLISDLKYTLLDEPLPNRGYHHSLPDKIGVLQEICRNNVRKEYFIN